MRFPPTQRLRHRSQFEAVRKEGHRIHCGAFIFQALPREDSGDCRIGIITSRKVGNAVIRNRARRLFREIFRRHRNEFSPPADIVVVVRSTYRRESFDQLENRFSRAVRNFNHACGSPSFGESPHEAKGSHE